MEIDGIRQAGVEAGVFQALEKKDYALLHMGVNYTRDTTIEVERRGEAFLLTRLFKAAKKLI